MRLHDNEQIFKEAIQATADHFKVRDVFVEKDYWVTYVLKNLSQSKYFDSIVFKGGTSISKAYKIAKRFSEDIDLALTKLTESPDQQEEVFKTIETAIALFPLEEQVDKSWTSKNKKFRQSFWSYPKKTIGQHDPAKEKIQLELTSTAVTYPNKEMKIQSLVAEFLKATKRSKEIKVFGLESFKVKVLSHKRTFAEKVVAVANASLKDDGHKTLKEKIRHLFDLTVLYDKAEIKKFTKSSGFNKMVKEARDGDKLISGFEVIATKPWRSADIFQKPKSVLAELEKTYKNELGPFIFNKSTMPSIADIEKMLKSVSAETKKKTTIKRKVNK